MILFETPPHIITEEKTQKNVSFPISKPHTLIERYFNSFVLLTANVVSKTFPSYYGNSTFSGDARQRGPEQPSQDQIRFASLTVK